MNAAETSKKNNSHLEVIEFVGGPVDGDRQLVDKNANSIAVTSKQSPFEHIYLRRLGTSIFEHTAAL